MVLITNSGSVTPAPAPLPLRPPAAAAAAASASSASRCAYSAGNDLAVFVCMFNVCVWNCVGLEEGGTASASSASRCAYSSGNDLAVCCVCDVVSGCERAAVAGRARLQRLQTLLTIRAALHAQLHLILAKNIMICLADWTASHPPRIFLSVMDTGSSRATCSTCEQVVRQVELLTAV